MEFSNTAVRQGRDYLRKHGLGATVRRFFHLWRHGPESGDVVTLGSESLPLAPAPVPAALLLRQRFLALQPLRVYAAPGGGPRLNLVTDSINKGSLFGGVATAIILAALLAEREGRRLRVITRTEVPHPDNLRHVLMCNGIAYDGNVDFVHCAVEGDSPDVDIGADEVFLTTSWWTTACVLGSIPPERVIYLLQEDERMFYPLGDDHLRCSELLNNQSLRFVVNTRLLHSHLLDSGAEGVRHNSRWFEPAFDTSTFFLEPRPDGERFRLVYYARPNNLRNLFYRGLEVLERAVNQGVLDLTQWDIVLLGKDLPDITFGDGYRPLCYSGLSWEAYAALLRKSDLGLCLMYTPHPSYPPLDIAACGGVVVTNRFGAKADLAQYSQNIIAADTDVDSLLEALRQGIDLATDSARRQANLAGGGLARSWRVTLRESVEWLAGSANVLH